MIRSRTPLKGEAVARHYEDLDHFYRTLWGEHLHHGLWLSGQEDHASAVVQLSRFVAQRANIKPGMAVCDVGCGYGATARLLAQEYDARVMALTVTPLQYEYAQSYSSGDTELASNRPSYRLLDWLKNDFASGSFEAVIAIESTEHMADLDQCIAEASRVLQSGGRFVVCAWLSSEKPLPWQIRHLLEPICREGRLQGMGSESDYRRCFSRADLQIVSVEDLSRQVKRTWTLCLARALRAVLVNAQARRFVLDHRQSNRIFALTLARLWLAYQVGAMRYVVFTTGKP